MATDELKTALRQADILDTALHGDRNTPAVWENGDADYRHKGIENETPNARAMVYMKAKGMTCLEIANCLGVSVDCVQLTVRQPWFIERLHKVLKELGIDELKDIIQIYSREALDVVHHFMLSASTDKIRTTCAFKLLDIGIGDKHNVTYERPQTPTSLNDKISSLTEEIEALQKGSKPCQRN